MSNEKYCKLIFQFNQLVSLCAVNANSILIYLKSTTFVGCFPFVFCHSVNVLTWKDCIYGCGYHDSPLLGLETEGDFMRKRRRCYFQWGTFPYMCSRYIMTFASSVSHSGFIQETRCSIQEHSRVYLIFKNIFPHIKIIKNYFKKKLVTYWEITHWSAL